jgi:DNA-binding NarL/FixJ family response regulator
MKVAALVDDLLFSSKIAAVARKCGATVTFFRTPQSVPEDAELILMDLEAPGLDAIAAIKALKTARAAKVVGYVSHVQVELKRRAEEAGADIVLPRSAFVNQLAELLTSTN